MIFSISIIYMYIVYYYCIREPLLQFALDHNGSCNQGIELEINEIERV